MIRYKLGIKRGKITLDDLGEGAADPAKDGTGRYVFSNVVGSKNSFITIYIVPELDIKLKAAAPELHIVLSHLIRTIIEYHLLKKHIGVNT